MLSNAEFRALLDLIMVSDPDPIPALQMAHVKNIAEREAHVRGFINWVEAFHKFER